MTAAFVIPKALQGGKLRLRPLKEKDAPALLEAIEVSRPVLRRRLRWVDSVQGIEDCKAFILRSLPAAEMNEVVLGIFEGRAGRLIGVAALQNPAEDGAVAEFSVWVRADRRRRGHAFEAAKALITHCFRKAGLRRLYARLEPANREGRKLVRKLGFRYEGRLRREKRLNGRWVDQECWGILREEWRK
ncbi:MAG: GNAT family N-acetyltransferase [Elusimicrobia bacterium]|nr:GNAT family N-acetyltransferase [Elusimicrobiota bacterium]